MKQHLSIIILLIQGSYTFVVDPKAPCPSEETEPAHDTHVSEPSEPAEAIYSDEMPDGIECQDDHEVGFSTDDHEAHPHDHEGESKEEPILSSAIGDSSSLKLMIALVAMALF
jgi:hypothetical protein